MAELGGTSTRSIRAGLCAILLVALLPAAAAGQGAEGLVTFQFSFSSPGARSLGMGGAFAALADDSTAAFANPAGIVQILEPEFSLEGRAWSYSTPYTEGGRIDGKPTGFGIDTTSGLRGAESNDRLSGLSFLSLVYPRKRWSLAIYRHQLANFEFSSETSGLFRVPDPPFSPDLTARSLDVRASTESDIVGYGLSAAWRASDRLSLGIGFSFFDGTLTSTADGYFPDSPERFFDRNSYLPERQAVASFFSLDDTDVGLLAGCLWRLSDTWTVGSFFRQGPEFELNGEAVAGPAAALLGFVPGAVLNSLRSVVELPDVYGLGLAFRSAGGNLVASFEWDRVEYATILDSLDFDTRTALDDGDELHLGGEYVFLETTPIIAVRIGAWLDPDHRSRATTEDPVERALFRPGTDELHLAVGLGFALERFQLDLAVDFSDHADTTSLSIVRGL